MCQPSSTNCPKAFPDLKSERKEKRAAGGRAEEADKRREPLRSPSEGAYAAAEQASDNSQRFQTAFPACVLETHGRRAAAERQKQGGNSAGDPPLPIPNREVKPRHADGTAKVGE